ncbi:MORN repeat-containing protein 5-like isoform X2 [Choristoneura fumiferana]|uniref:MORN repeat-containing protein 5-like isoform X2 n=1 Tax=Choristoneura fumiferana TaxID=7141 RepID=UPI003D155692
MSLEKCNSVATDKRVSQWEELMRKFSEAHKEECKALSLDIPRVQRAVKKFPTGSSYEGTWDVLGMSGHGTYTFSNGVIYEGDFDDGTFHGSGELRYPSGAILRGKWRHGEMTQRTLIFGDGLEYSETDWKYCRMPDRRFTVEYDTGLQPAGRSYLTADQPTREIPLGYYDTGDGFFDPKTKLIYKPTDLTYIIRCPSIREQQWILDNCRTNPIKPLGPREDLYEKWSEPMVTPEVPPPPAAASRVGAASSATSAHMEDQEIEITFIDLAESSDSSSTSSSSSTYA